MSLVDHQDSAMLLSQIYDIRERRFISVHTEQRLCYNELSAIARRIFQSPFELIHIAMSVYKDLCTRETTTVDDTGMIERIAQNHISLSHQNRNDARVCLETGIKYQRRFRSFQLRDPALQFFVQGHVPGN